jgi:hypothetical protein
MIALLHRMLVSSVSIVFLLAPQVVWAADGDPDHPWEKAGVSLGAFFSALDGNLRIGAGLGVDIDLEDALALDGGATVLRADALWRFSDNRRHRLDLTWFSYRRSGSRTLVEDITIENDAGNQITIDAGTSVDANFDLDIYELAYTYSFFQDDRIDLAVGVGLYVMPIDYGIRATGIVNEQGSGRFTAPLPVLGLRADVALTPRWFIRSGAQVFYLEYESFTGSVLEFRSALEYYPWQHVGIGLGFDTFGLRLQADEEDWPGVDLNGKVSFNYAGVQLYLRYFF